MRQFRVSLCSPPGVSKPIAGLRIPEKKLREETQFQEINYSYLTRGKNKVPLLFAKEGHLVSVLVQCGGDYFADFPAEALAPAFLEEAPPCLPPDLADPLLE